MFMKLIQARGMTTIKMPGENLQVAANDVYDVVPQRYARLVVRASGLVWFALVRFAGALAAILSDLTQLGMVDASDLPSSHFYSRAVRDGVKRPLTTPRVPRITEIRDWEQLFTHTTYKCIYSNIWHFSLFLHKFLTRFLQMTWTVTNEYMWWGFLIWDFNCVKFENILIESHQVLLRSGRIQEMKDWKLKMWTISRRCKKYRFLWIQRLAKSSSICRLSLFRGREIGSGSSWLHCSANIETRQTFSLLHGSIRYVSMRGTWLRLARNARTL